MLVAEHVSPKLDQLKHTYQGLPHYLTQVRVPTSGFGPKQSSCGL